MSNPNPIESGDEFAAARSIIERLRGDTVLEVEMEEGPDSVQLILLFESGAVLRIPMEQGLDILIPLTPGAAPRGN